MVGRHLSAWLAPPSWNSGAVKTWKLALVWKDRWERQIIVLVSGFQVIFWRERENGYEAALGRPKWGSDETHPTPDGGEGGEGGEGNAVVLVHAVEGGREAVVQDGSVCARDGDGGDDDDDAA